MKKILCVFLTMMMLAVSWTAVAETNAETQLEKEIGAFEITAMQREMAKTNSGGYPVLDAGRGNPNWINTQTRYAFTRFMEFALGECERVMKDGAMAGHGTDFPGESERGGLRGNCQKTV